MATKIEWATETWNPVVGCTKCSTGCEDCWAEAFAKRLKGMGIPQYQNVVNRNGWTGEISLVEKALDIPLHWKKPRVIFPVSMGDLFHPGVPFEFIDRMVSVMTSFPQHKYLILTKRPERMAEYQWIDWVDGSYDMSHIHLGATICNQAEQNKNAPILSATPPARKWHSYEPLLGPIDILSGADLLPDYVVLGCESGPKRRPCKLEWMIDVVEQCQAVSIPVFVKQVNINGRVSHNMAEWPEKLRVRDEVIPNPPKENK